MTRWIPNPTHSGFCSVVVAMTSRVERALVVVSIVGLVVFTLEAVCRALIG